MIGKQACARITVVTCDQHKGYADSVREHCPGASLVWDKFHLVQAFNEALNEERKQEWDKYGDPEMKEDDLLGQYSRPFPQRNKKYQPTFSSTRPNSIYQ